MSAVGPSSSSFQYNLPGFANLALRSGTVTPATFGATEVGSTATITTTAAHNLSVGDIVVVAGVTPSGYNCAAGCAVLSTSTANTFTYTAGTSGLANGGVGTVTKNSPFQIQIGGNDLTLIGGSGALYNNANIQTAINGIAGWRHRDRYRRGLHGLHRDLRWRVGGIDAELLIRQPLVWRMLRAGG